MQNTSKIYIVCFVLLAFISFKVDKESFGNLEWIASGIFCVLLMITVLLAEMLENLEQDK